MLKPRFSAVAEAFSRVVGKGDDRGAALCVYHRGVPVVDTWAGTADVKTRRPWNENTIAPVTGATKGCWPSQCCSWSRTARSAWTHPCTCPTMSGYIEGADANARQLAALVYSALP